MEEPTYGNKPVLNIIHDRGLQVQFLLEQRKENEVMQKCLMKVCCYLIDFWTDRPFYADTSVLANKK